MIFSYLKPDNLKKKYEAAKSYTESLTDPFPEFERISRNKAKGSIPKGLPRVTDGTTASILRKSGKRVVQQLPTGKVESDDDNAWLPVVAEFIFTHRILPFANDEYSLIDKCWQVIERGGTFGSCATFSPFVNHDGHFSPDVNLEYWGDIFVAPGSKSGYSSPYIFRRAWWQEEDVDALIDKEQKLATSAKERGEPYEATWNIDSLKSIKELAQRKDDKATTPSESDRNVNPEGIEVITGFQNGVGSTFYTFVVGATDTSGDITGVTILREKKNKDPRGKMPIDWYYNDSDGSNPLGRGIVELIGGLQNLMDADMQAYQWIRQLMMNPPIEKRGSFSKKKIVYAPGVIIDLGDDPNASIKPLDVNTTAIEKYPDLYGLQKSQLLNLVSSPDTSISAEIGNPGFGKTPSAINAQQATMSVDDNYTRKKFEEWFENSSETWLNLYFAERSGVEKLQLDKATAERLRKLAQEGKFDESMLSENNEILIDYDTETPALSFRIDASTSKMKQDAEQGDILASIGESLDQSPLLAQLVPPEKVLALYNRRVANSGVEDPEDLTIDLEQFKQQQEQAQAQQMAAQSMQPDPNAQPAQQMPQQDPQAQPQVVPQDQVPQGMPQIAAEAGQPQEQLPAGVDPEDSQLIDEFKAMGLPDSLIMEAIDMLDQGFSAEDVLQSIQEVTHGQ